MDIVLQGFLVALQPHNLLFCFIGVFLGTLIGVLPGIGSIAAISLLLPFTYYMDPTSSLVMLAGIYYGSEYGGSISSILLNLPSGVSNVVVCLDGYPMAQQGRAGVALFITTTASFIGGAIGIILMMLAAPMIVQLTLSFGAAEYFAIMLFGLLAAAAITGGSPIKGISMVILGVLLGAIGTDINTGISRFTFGSYELAEGLSIAVLALGLIGVSEVISSIRQQLLQPSIHKVTLRSMIPTANDWRRSIMPTLRGSGIGSFFGILPGVGPSIATFLSYTLEKRVSSTPEQFGKGSIAGIAAPESANNASVQAAFIPTISLGVPGTASMALMLGAMLIHGITPGPRFISNHPDIFWALVGSFWVGNVLLVILNIPMVGIWVRMLTIPYRYLYPGILGLLACGMYAMDGSVLAVYLVLAFGLLGLFLRRGGFPLAPLLVGFILGPMIEENFRRSMLLFRGDFAGFLSRPIALSILGACLIVLLFSLSDYTRRSLKRERSAV